MLTYFIIISIISVLVTIYDKAAAGERHTRVPERILLGLGLIGGALAMFITMLLIRHKTRKIKFMAGLPVMIILHIILLMIFATH